MITVEKIFHERDGLTVRGIHRKRGFGAEWVEIEFTDGSRIEVEEFARSNFPFQLSNGQHFNGPPPADAVKPAPPPSPPPIRSDPTCMVCARMEAEEMKALRNLGLPTVNLVYEAINKHDPKDDYAAKVRKVRAWARDTINGKHRRTEEATKYHQAPRRD
jgi:hypothetical protein